MPTARRRSEETLAALGLETALDTVRRLEEAGDATGARALRRWVNTDPAEIQALLRSLPGTRGGQGRELRIGMCGVAFVARRDGTVGFARRGCKDRLCPTCSARRSRRFAAALREWCAANPWTWRRFVTFTQPKVAGESPRAALDRLLAAYRRMLERWGKPLLRGGVRSLEVTARKAGTRIPRPGQDDYVVAATGVHAHLHCIIDGSPAAFVPCLRRPTKANRRGDLDRRPRVTLVAAAWVRSCEGASVAGVDVQDVTDENIYQVSNYSVDMSGLLDVLTAAPGYVRAVLGALHGRRLVAAFGTWRKADLGLRETEGTLVYGDRSVWTLATGQADAADGYGDPPPVKWSDGETEPALAVLAALLDGPRRPV